MKLIRFGEKGNEKPGVILNGKRKDCSQKFQDWNRGFFQHDGLAKLGAYIKKEGENLPDVPADARHASCIARPGMIICVGLNYSEHAKESNMELPKEPIVFAKATNTITGPYDDVAIPRNSNKTDYEVELGVVLKHDVAYLASEAEAAEAIAGYCLVNDLSERTFQLERGGQWIKGKSCPGFCPTGPFLRTADELGPVDDIGLTLSVNGKIRQKSSTKYMIFRPAFLIHYISQFMALEAGDLVSTGTPPGVAMGMNDPTAYLKKGDVAEMEITGLGSQKQRYV